MSCRSEPSGPSAARSRRRTPSRSRSGVSATWSPTLLLVGERLDPGEAVGVRPHRVVDAGEVDVERAPALLEEVRQEERQLVHGERVLRRPGELVPRRAGCGGVWIGRGTNLFHAFGYVPPSRGDRAEQRVEQEQAASDLPAAEVAGRRGAPGVRRRAACRPSATTLGDLAQRRRRRRPTRARRARTCRSA